MNTLSKGQSALLKLLPLVIWEVASGIAENPLFPSPITIFANLKNLLNFDWLSKFLAPSLYTVTLGFTIGVVLAIFLGLLVSINKLIADAIQPSANFVRSIPTVAKLPILISLFGLEMQSRVAMIAVASFSQPLFLRFPA